jgi:hypothetical protein
MSSPEVLIVAVHHEPTEHAADGAGEQAADGAAAPRTGPDRRTRSCVRNSNAARIVATKIKMRFSSFGCIMESEFRKSLILMKLP